MDIEHLFSQLTYHDLQWMAPVAAGLVIVIGGLLIGIVRGMSVGVLAALILGGAMSLSPIIVGVLDKTPRNQLSPATLKYARDNLALASLNSEAANGLIRVANSMRIALDGLSPLLDGSGEGDAAAVARYKRSLDDLEERIKAISGSVGEGEELVRSLTDDLDALAAEAAAGQR